MRYFFEAVPNKKNVPFFSATFLVIIFCLAIGINIKKTRNCGFFIFS